ncbi:hypothetical protein E2C01_080224 [Portunus trituberculatus]|uniref:Uncharacterized protein n=1 Tax=Portunus trituberculatus TaxID=210409 RepID=A0A5B7IUU8_PORTR|nr:hypothetical protein [Portunus trituberculatus]
MKTCDGTEEVKSNTGTHFYLDISVPLDHFIDIRKSLWRSED